MDVVGSISEVKANHAPQSSFVEFAGLVGGEHKAVIQDAVDKMATSNHQVIVCWWNEKQVKAGCTAVSDAVALPPGEELMHVVEMEDLGTYPCGGTHLSTTPDIGKVVESYLDFLASFRIRQLSDDVCLHRPCKYPQNWEREVNMVNYLYHHY